MAKKARSHKRGKPLPPCKALLLCEKVIVEQGTGNITVVGIFTGFVVKKFPAHLRGFYVFMQVIDGIGRYEMSVEVHNLHDQTCIAKSSPIAIEFADRPNGGHIIIPVPPLPIKKEGAYDVVVMADGQEIQKQKFSVTMKTMRSQKMSQVLQTMTSPYLGKDNATRRKVQMTSGEVIYAGEVVVLTTPEPLTRNRNACRARTSKKTLSEKANENMPPQAWFDEPEADLTKPV